MELDPFITQVADLEHALTDLLHNVRHLSLELRRASDRAVVLLMALQRAQQGTPENPAAPAENPPKPG